MRYPTQFYMLRLCISRNKPIRLNHGKHGEVDIKTGAVGSLLDDGVHVKDTIVDTGGYVHGRIHSEESGERSTP